MQKLSKFFIMFIILFSILFFSNKIYGKYMFSEELQAYDISIRNWETNIRKFSIINDGNLEFKILDGDTIIADNEIINSNMIKYDKEYILEIYNNSDYYYNLDINANNSEINSFTECLELKITNFEENTILFNGTSIVASNSYFNENKNFISIPEFIPSNTPLKFKFRISTDLLREVEKDDPNYIKDNNCNIQFNILTSLPTWDVSATENDNVVATLYGNTLKITGNGNMKDLMNLPWSKYRGNITKVEIENGITNIGNYAFLAYTSLTSVEIPDSVINIGELAFCSCTSLESITLPNSITSIGKQTFQQCINLKEIKGLENTKITTITYQLFYKCTSLKSLNIPDSVINIKDNAFIACTSITSIEIPDNIINIGNSIFSEWTKDQTIYCDFYSQPTTWDTAWDGLCNANIIWKKISWDVSATENDNVKVILYSDEKLLISGNGDMKKFEYDDVPWQDYKSSITKVEVEDGITSISNYVFSKCVFLKSVNLSNTIKKIGEYTFLDCTSLKSINIPDSVISIGNGVFANCTSLEDISISNNIVKIGNDVFLSCTALKNIEIPDSVISIGEWTFAYCESLTSVVLPNSIISIGESAFNECINLKEIKGLENTKITTIENESFAYCKSLIDIILPSSVTSIGESVFKDCTSLKSINIPDSVINIKYNAFLNCISLKSIEIPNSVKNMDENVFYNCTSLVSIYCDFYSQPTAWNTNWNQGCYANIVWKSNINTASNIKESTFVNNINNVYKNVPQLEEFQVNIYGES